MRARFLSSVFRRGQISSEGPTIDGGKQRSFAVAVTRIFLELNLNKRKRG